MKVLLVISLGLKRQGISPLAKIAADIVLGLELAAIKRAGNYEGGGSWQADRESCVSGNRPVWERLVQDVAGITEVAATHYFQCAMAVKIRLKDSPQPEAREVLALMEIRPSELTEKQREELVRGIEAHGLSDGDTKFYLRKEYKAAFITAKPVPPYLVRDADDPAENPDPGPLLSVMAEEMRHRDKDAALARLALRAFTMMKSRNRI